MAARGYWRGFTTGVMIGAGAATGALLFTKSIEAVLRDFKHALENPGQTGPRT